MRTNQCKNRGRYCSLLFPALVMLVSACASTDKMVPHTAKPTNFMLGENAMIGLENAQAVIDDKTKLRGQLEKYANNTKAKLGPLIADVTNRNAATPGGTNPFRGLGGGYYISLLKAAEGKVGANSEYDPAKTSSVELSGLITGYAFTRMGNKGSGELTVDTYQTVKHEGQTVQENNYVWTIKINPNGYDIHTHKGNNDDPFPGTIFFDQAMLDRIEEKGFNVKIHARGAGAIKIKNVKKDGSDIKSNDKDFGPLLRSDPENCIDIFFKVKLGPDGKPDLDDIPTTLAELKEHSYCLGRCKSPAIINSR